VRKDRIVNEVAIEQLDARGERCASRQPWSRRGADRNDRDHQAKRSAVADLRSVVNEESDDVVVDLATHGTRELEPILERLSVNGDRRRKAHGLDRDGCPPRNAVAPHEMGPAMTTRENENNERDEQSTHRRVLSNRDATESRAKASTPVRLRVASDGELPQVAAPDFSLRPSANPSVFTSRRTKWKT